MQKSVHPYITVVNQSSHETERLSQLQYGRKKLVLPSTSTSQTTGKKVMNHQPKKIQKVGHEACLSKVISERRKLDVVLINNTRVQGELLEDDRFSIRLRLDDGSYMWYFKGSIIGFAEVV